MRIWQSLYLPPPRLIYISRSSLFALHSDPVCHSESGLLDTVGWVGYGEHWSFPHVCPLCSVNNCLALVCLFFYRPDWTPNPLPLFCLRYWTTLDVNEFHLEFASPGSASIWIDSSFNPLAQLSSGTLPPPFLGIFLSLCPMPDSAYFPYPVSTSFLVTPLWNTPCFSCLRKSVREANFWDLACQDIPLYPQGDW